MLSPFSILLPKDKPRLIGVVLAYGVCCNADVRDYGTPCEEYLNFSEHYGMQGGPTKEFAQSWMPIYRQRIFIVLLANNLCNATPATKH